MLASYRTRSGSVVRASRARDADYLLLRVAKGAGADLSLEASSSCKLARLVIGVLPNRQIETFRDTVVANRLRLKTFNERFDLLQNSPGHRLSSSDNVLVTIAASSAGVITGSFRSLRSE